jgi:peptidoglycan hydrolase-like protein with peptidoglycan-binding domain
MQAYHELSNGDMLVSEVSGLLRMGSSGKQVREVQAALNRAGATLKIDGDFGPSTRDAVKVFQKAKGLKVDGVVGPATMKLILAIPQPESDPGHIAAVDNKNVRNAAAASFAGLGAAATADKLTGIADKLGGTGIAFVDYITVGMYGLAAALVIGGLGYGMYAHLKANRTEYGAS